MVLSTCLMGLAVAGPSENASTVPISNGSTGLTSNLATMAQAITPDLDGIGQQFNQLASGVTGVRDSLSQTTSDLVLNAMEFLGVPYKRGGASASTGFDCSGFVRSVYENTLGTVLPRRAAEQAQSTQVIQKDELRPGDLVFFNTMRRAFSHVGIYVGDNKFIHAPRAGGKVRVEDMRETYWTNRFNGARRVTTSIAPSEIPVPVKP